MDIINLVIGAVILILGYIIKKYNLSMLIAGYNTAGKEEQAKYDEKKMTRYVGNMLMITALALIIRGIIFSFYNEPLFAVWIFWGLFAVWTIACLIYLNTGNRLKK